MRWALYLVRAGLRKITSTSLGIGPKRKRIITQDIYIYIIGNT